MSDNRTVKIFIESTDGERFAAEVPADLELGHLAADFFEEREWNTRDSRGRSQRAVVELVNPEQPNRTKRLRGEQTVADAGLWEGAVLRIFPESIAGQVDERQHIRALVADHQDMVELASWNRRIVFQPNLSHAPFIYSLTLDYPSIVGLQADNHTPRLASAHRLEITLGAAYPKEAPRARWQTEIFHPNIHPDTGDVCLGVLQDRYLPGVGLARVVTMLTEMIQWRNFDLQGYLNERAARWAQDPQHWPHIFALGGSPFQGPIAEFLEKEERKQRRPITFQRLSQAGAA